MPDPDGLPPELLAQIEANCEAETVIHRIRVILGSTTRPGCFGGLPAPGMDYSEALAKIRALFPAARTPLEAYLRRALLPGKCAECGEERFRTAEGAICALGHEDTGPT